MKGRVRLDVWSDYVCPFCYLELPVVERLRRELGAALEVEWHAFELRPEPVPTLDPSGEYLREAWARSVLPMARERGMALALPPVQPRSRKAFESAEFARDHDRFEAMNRAIFKAFFEEGRDIGQVEVLASIAESARLDAASLRASLADARYLERVLRAETWAQRLGIRSVPTLVLRRPGEPLERGRAVAGAISEAQLLQLAREVAAAA
jgi:predicted DsbA family dithiol-disulfide isomerase